MSWFRWVMVGNVLCFSTSFFFFFNDTATTEIYTLSLHDALSISSRRDSRSHAASRVIRRNTNRRYMIGDHHRRRAERATPLVRAVDAIIGTHRSGSPGGGQAPGPAAAVRESTWLPRSSESVRCPAAFSRSSRGGDPPNRTSGPTNWVSGEKAMPTSAGNGTGACST